MNELTRNHRALLLLGAFLLVAVLAFGIGRFSGKGLSPVRPENTEASSQPSDSLSVTNEAIALMEIAVEPAAGGDLSAEVSAPGVVSSAINGEAIVTAHAAGTVMRVTRRLGESVKAGETLALVASGNAAAIAAERRSAESRAALARSVLKRERGLFEQRVTPRQDLETAEAQAEAAEAEAARARIAAHSAHVSNDGQFLEVVSPIAGRVTNARASLGAYVDPDTELFRVTDPRNVVVEVAVPAADSARISPGDRAQVTVLSGSALVATVAAITPTVNAETGSATATLTLAEGQATPVPGEFARALIMPRSEGSKEIVVADEAVQRVKGRDVVFVRSENGFKIRPVTVGARSSGRVAVRSGLREGEVVATRNAFLLKAEVEKGAEEEE